MLRHDPKMKSTVKVELNHLQQRTLLHSRPGTIRLSFIAPGQIFKISLAVVAFTPSTFWDRLRSVNHFKLLAHMYRLVNRKPDQPTNLRYFKSEAMNASAGGAIQ